MSQRLQFVARAVLALLLVLFAAWVAHAHPLDSASLSLGESTPGRFHVRFQAGSSSLQQQLVEPAVFPEPCRMKGAYLECGRTGLVGAIEFPWLEGTLTRVMVVIEWRDGSRLSRVVTASAPSLTVYGLPATGVLSVGPIAIDYAHLGVKHILLGFDHLLFVVALALLVQKRARLLVTVTGCPPSTFLARLSASISALSSDSCS